MLNNVRVVLNNQKCFVFIESFIFKTLINYRWSFFSPVFGDDNVGRLPC